MKNIDNLSLKGINISNSLDLFESEELLDKALNNFLTTIDDRMKKLKLARSKGDMKEYYINIHLVNNSALRLGLKKLSDITSIHEKESKRNNLSYIYENYNNLVDAVKEIKEAITDYFKE